MPQVLEQVVELVLVDLFRDVHAGSGWMVLFRFRVSSLFTRQFLAIFWSNVLVCHRSPTTCLAERVGISPTRSFTWTLCTTCSTRLLEEGFRRNERAGVAFWLSSCLLVAELRLVIVVEGWVFHRVRQVVMLTLHRKTLKCWQR